MEGPLQGLLISLSSVDKHGLFYFLNWIKSGIIFLTDVLDENGLKEGQNAYFDMHKTNFMFHSCLNENLFTLYYHAINCYNNRKSVTHQRWESLIANVWMDNVALTYKHQHQQASSSHHQACVYQYSFRSDISFLRYRAETKQVSNFCSIFRSCDLDLCSTNLIINRLPPLTTWHVCTKFHLDPTFRS